MTFLQKTHRWSDSERSIGPITFSRDKGSRWAVVIKSGDDEYPSGHFRVSVPGFTVLLQTGRLIKPHSEWVDLSKHEWATSKGYTQTDARAFGFSVSKGFLQVFRGRKTNDSSTDRTLGYFIPWQRWRHVRHEIYDVNGASLGDFSQKSYDHRHAVLANANHLIRYRVHDFDGSEVIASTYVEELEWRRGEGWFKWLGVFWPKKLRRYLNIDWSAETGPEKGSWKGGIIGQSIDLLPGETSDQAMRRFCDQEHRHKGRTYRMTYLGREETAHD